MSLDVRNVLKDFLMRNLTSLELESSGSVRSADRKFGRDIVNDKELADKVVALGVGKFLPAKQGKIHLRSEDGYNIGFLDSTLSEFVRDWRVAGVLMERLFQQDNFSFASTLKLWSALASARFVLHEDNDESMPRVIIEACVEALCEK